MWKSLAEFTLKYKYVLLAALVVSTIFMAYRASKVTLSYEFSKAIPTDNPKYIDYQFFRNKFGDDGNMLVIGVQSKDLFRVVNFKAYVQMLQELKQVNGVTDILSIPGAVTLAKDSSSEKIAAVKIFDDGDLNQAQIDSSSAIFFNLPFYKGVLYNGATDAYLMGVKIDKNILNSAKRTVLVKEIQSLANAFTQRTGIHTYLSGLPLIRTVLAEKVKGEMKLFLLVSLLLSTVMLLLFFRSISTTILSLAVVMLGVVWTIGITEVCGYQITLLTALIPSLVVVIGIPNCIYFINKYHIYIQQGYGQHDAIVAMVSKMGVVTLFCNITAAIGFAVFAFTRSAILQEFGVVASLSIMVIFFISFLLLPAVLSLLPAPGKRELQYLHSPWISRLLLGATQLVLHHAKAVIGVTVFLALFALAGIFKLQTVAYILDDLPKTDVLYKDLRFFEQNFKGVMPLEILIDTKKSKGILQTAIDVRTIAFFQDSILAQLPNVGKPISVIDGIKFSYQAVSEGQGDSTYTLPAFGNPLLDLHKTIRELQIKKTQQLLEAKDSAMVKLVGNFVDSSEQFIRISMSMEDVGTKKLPVLLDSIRRSAATVFDSSYKVTLTGSTITFLEGSQFIINGLKESIVLAFLLIAVCMLYLFKSFKILICSLVPNIIPLLVTAGIMGWAGVPIKPSTVLVFSVALGIAVDITIRFLVNYKQVLPEQNNDVVAAVRVTIAQTGLSIVYTSLVLTAGFIIFCASSFGGTFALGWLTSVTLLVATITNLVLLPVLIIMLGKK